MFSLDARLEILTAPETSDQENSLNVGSAWASQRSKNVIRRGPTVTPLPGRLILTDLT